MDRRAYERMEQEVRAIHRALTGEDPRVDGAWGAPGGSEPAEASAATAHEVERRFLELALEARSVPSIAAELSALGLAPVLAQSEEALVEAPLPGVGAGEVGASAAPGE